jgi:aspartate aminotransferase-like enzyme
MPMPMAGLRPDVDPQGLREFSVVFSDRSLNHMSEAFQDVMRSLSETFCRVYQADALAIVPGGGSLAMEAVARQLATGRRCLVIRNGWFSYRWSQIFEAGGIPAETQVMKARPQLPWAEAEAPADAGADLDAALWAPAPLEEVVASIHATRPDVVIAPHVETSAGILLPDSYLRAVTEATHAVGGIFILDCVASGTLWVDMASLGVDVLITAPQKGWSSTPCAGLVLLSAAGRAAVRESKSSSFALDLARWLDIMEAYLKGGHAYHATMPTDGLRALLAQVRETEAMGWEVARAAQSELGTRIRASLAARGFRSVAAPGFEAPSVVVAHTDDPSIQSGARFRAEGVQIAAGVPLMCDEPEGFRTFRIGLFGLDKLKDVDGTVRDFEAAMDAVMTGVPS